MIKSFPVNSTTKMIAGGKYYDLLDLDLSDLTIIDLANALDTVYRFSGCGKRGMSVCEHSVRVSTYFFGRNRVRAALLHDAAEIFIGDISTPVKKSSTYIQNLEKFLKKELFNHFDVPESYIESQALKLADARECRVEVMTMFGKEVLEEWGLDSITLDDRDTKPLSNTPAGEFVLRWFNC